MNTLDMLSKIAPGFAARRMQNMLSYQVNSRNYEVAKRLYEAATPDQYRKPLTGAGLAPNAVMASAGAKLRDLARHLEENHDLTVAVFDDLLNNVIGTGANIAPMIRKTDGSLAKELNKEVLELFDEWGQSPDTTGELGFEQVERQVARHLFRDGEIFVRPIFANNFRYQTPVPFVLDLLDADYCPMDLSQGDILQGIRCNQWGQPVAYYFYKNHPGEVLQTASSLLSNVKEVGARGVYHLKFSRRLRQRRGIPVIHAVINRMRDIKDYEESERIAAKVAADFTFAITKETEAGAPTDLNGANNRALQMQAGMGFELLPGEDVSLINSDRPNSGLNEFRDAMLRAVAGGTGTRFSSISRNYNGTYSAQRQELVEGAVSYRVHFGYLTRRFYRPVWGDFMTAAVLSNKLRNLRGVDMSTITRCDFRAPALPWIDPKKEADAWKLLVDAKLESRREIQRQRGRDPDKVFEELTEEAGETLFASAIEQAPETIADDVATDETEDGDSEAAA